MERKGVTLIEMLIVMVVASILLLTIGTLSSIGNKSYKKIVRQAAIYNDIAYGFKLISNRVHKTRSISLETPSSPWVGDKFIVGSEAFGLYKTSSTMDFVHLPDKDDSANQETIFSVSNSDTINVSWSISGESVTCQISGSKDNIPFSLTSTAVQRI